VLRRNREPEHNAYFFYFFSEWLEIQTNVLYDSEMTGISLSEIFPSIQGEGPWIGERHIFVRFFGCELRCRYCDTSASVQAGMHERAPKFCMVQKLSDPHSYDQIPNPVSSADLTGLCRRFILPGPSRPTISLTGGEPLLHASFLLEWLPVMRNTFRIYLETNGIHAGAMRDLWELIDVVSMDLKLPSATRLRPYWEEHKRFLAEAAGKTLYAKAVVTNDTTGADIITAAGIIAASGQRYPLVLQPASGEFAPEAARLLEFQNAALSRIDDVRVIPQAHKILNVP
jgi:organic radical activating enzyme